MDDFIKDKALLAKAISKNQFKYSITYNKKKYFLHLHHSRYSQQKECQIISLCRQHKINVPKIVSTKKVTPFLYYNLVTAVDGKALSSIKINNPYRLAEAVYSNICRLHEVRKNNRSLVHGDLNYSNIFVDKKCNISFIDFSTSRFSHPWQDWAFIYACKEFFDSGHCRGDNLKELKDPEAVCIIYKTIWNLAKKQIKFNDFFVECCKKARAKFYPDK
jgi:tRNA A-37 threonylcarbamoyl transferase component Bud32